MSKSSQMAAPTLLWTAVFLLAAGCGPASTGPGNPSQQGGLPPGPGGPGDPGGPPTNIKQIMSRIGKQPQNLHIAIGEALKPDQPAWDAFQPQTKDYAQLSVALTKMAPPKGSKESWDNQTASFAESASALEAAAAAKDRDAAKAAHAKLNSACMACHKDFRGRGPG